MSRSIAALVSLVALFSAACGGDPFTAALETAVVGDAGASSLGDAQPAEDAAVGQAETGRAATATGPGAHDAGTLSDVVVVGSAEAGSAEAGLFEAGPVEAGSPPPPCTTVTDLSNVGTADFHIEFTLVTTETGLTLALVNQRVATSCDTISSFWDIVLSPAGGIIASTDDGVHNVFVEAGDSVNDGKPHRIIVARTAGLLWYSDDGVVRSATVADGYALGALPPLVRGTDPCAGTTPLAGHGMMTDLCITVP